MEPLNEWKGSNGKLDSVCKVQFTILSLHILPNKGLSYKNFEGFHIPFVMALLKFLNELHLTMQT